MLPLFGHLTWIICENEFSQVLCSKSVVCSILWSRSKKEIDHKIKSFWLTHKIQIKNLTQIHVQLKIISISCKNLQPQYNQEIKSFFYHVGSSVTFHQLWINWRTRHCYLFAVKTWNWLFNYNESPILKFLLLF